MNGILVLVIGIAILAVAYLTYGKWLAKQWGIDPSRETPSHTEEDGVDYVPAKAHSILHSVPLDRAQNQYHATYPRPTSIPLFPAQIAVQNTP